MMILYSSNTKSNGNGGGAAGPANGAVNYMNSPPPPPQLAAQRSPEFSGNALTGGRAPGLPNNVNMNATFEPQAANEALGGSFFN